MLTPEICEAILRDHSRMPRNVGTCEAGRKGDIINPLCGDELVISLEQDAAGEITCARFEGAGCAASQAAASLLLPKLLHLPSDKALKLVQDLKRLVESGTASPEDHYEVYGDAAALLVFGSIPARVRCATLAASLVEDLLLQQE